MMIRKRLLKAMLLSTVSFSIWIGSTDTQALTLSDALVSAYETSPTLNTRIYEINSLAETAVQAQGALRPTITASTSIGITRQDPALTKSTFLKPYSLSVSGSQTLFDFGRTENSVEQAEFNIKSGYENYRSTEQSVLLSTVTAFLNVMRDNELLDLANNNKDLINEQLKAAEDRFEFGEVTKTDVSQAEARLAAAENAIAQSQGALILSEQAFLRASGIKAENLEPLPPLPDLPKTVDDAHAIALKNHPALTAARYAESSAREGVERAISNTKAFIQVQSAVRFNDNFGTGREHSSTAQIAVVGNVPIYEGGIKDSQIRQAQALVSQRRSQLHDSARQVTESVAIAWENINIARAAIAASNQQISAATVAYDGVKEEALFGSRTTLDVLDAEQELLNARTSLVTAQRDEYVAAYQLLSSVGMLTAKHLNLGVEEPDLKKYYQTAKKKWYGYDKDATKWKSSWE